MSYNDKFRLNEIRKWKENSLHFIIINKDDDHSYCFCRELVTKIVRRQYYITLEKYSCRVSRGIKNV